MDQIHPVSEDNLRIENQSIPNKKMNSREKLVYSMLVGIVIAVWFIVFMATYASKNK
tara:strand:- start:313 stop:483 length:171 start_codon:yes stop_codon:yes gene_type:complete